MSLPPPVPQTPHDLAELLRRARELSGRPLAQLAQAAGIALEGPGKRRKGKAGLVIEQLLGASAGNAGTPDFAHLGVELKTLPIDARGRPRESTFVCRFSLVEADRAEWLGSRVREKLRHVLFVPLIADAEPCVGHPFCWRPSREQDDQLAADFDEIMGLVAIGKVEELNGTVGKLLQARPKAAHGDIRTRAYGADGERVWAMPRGFYLRARFTAELLARGEDRA